MTAGRLAELARAERLRREAMVAQKAAAERDLLAFVRMMWPVLEPETPLIEGWLLDLLCLPYETKITTEIGRVPIGWYVESGGDARVLSFDHGTGRPEWKQVRLRRKSQGRQIVRIALCDVVMLVTEDHPVFVVGRGYVRADQIISGEKVLRLRQLRDDPMAMAISHSEPECLLQSGLPLSALQENGGRSQASPMRSLRSYIRAGSDEDEILQSKVFRGISCAAGSGDMSDLQGQEKLGRRSLSEVRYGGEENGGGGCLPDLRSPVMEHFGQAAKVLQSGVFRHRQQRVQQCRVHSRRMDEEISPRLLANAVEDTEARRPVLSAMQEQEGTAHSSHRQTGREQRTVESRDALPAMSSGSARPAGEVYTVVESDVRSVEREIRIPEHVYNISVEDNRNFFADGILVHNCDVMMSIADGDMTRVCINVPPGSTKSTLLNVFLPAWEWGPCNRPSLRYLSVSYSTAVPVRDNLRFSRIVRHPSYRRCWGDRFDIDRDGAEWVGNSKTGWKMVTSTSGGTTGHRADRLLLDDLNNPISVESDDVRLTTNRFIREVMPDRLNNLELSAIINLQQRTNQGDATGTLIEHGQGYQFVSIPMEFDPLRICQVVLRRDEAGDPLDVWVDPRSLDGSGRQLEGLGVNERGEPMVERGSPMARAEGESCWPERFPPDVIEKLRAEKGEYAWSCLPGEAPILMADLTQKPIRDIKIGDEICGFGTVQLGDWNKWPLRLTIVRDVHSQVKPVVKVKLNTGCPVRCTADHKWFTGAVTKAAFYRPVKVGRHLIHYDPAWGGASFLHGNFERIIDIQSDGEETVYGLTTDTGNYVAWGFASQNSQYQQIPGVRGGAIIRRDWWKLWTGEYPAVGTVVAALDTAYSQKDTADYNALTVWGAFAGEDGQPQFLLLDAWRIRTNLADLIRRIAETCRARKVDHLLIENKTRGQDVFNEIAIQFGSASWQTHLIVPEGEKIKRLNAVAPMFSGDCKRVPDGCLDAEGKPTFMEVWSGGMVFAPDRDFADEVISEVAAFPYGTHDDYCDTVSMALGWARRSALILRKAEWDEEELERSRFKKQIKVPYAIRMD